MTLTLFRPLAAICLSPAMAFALPPAITDRPDTPFKPATFAELGKTRVGSYSVNGSLIWALPMPKSPKRLPCRS